MADFLKISKLLSTSNVTKIYWLFEGTVARTNTTLFFCSVVLQLLCGHTRIDTDGQDRKQYPASRVVEISGCHCLS